MADKSDLKFYLTSAEPNLLNVIPSQSIGGYPSLTPYSETALLADALNMTNATFSVDGALKSPYAVVIDEEVMKLNTTTDLDGDYGATESLAVVRGGLGTNTRFHADGDLVFSADKNYIFNGSLNDSGKQYRCIAIKNVGTATFFGLKLYVKNPSRNSKSTVKIAVETPIDEVLYSESTGGGTISITDTSLIDAYNDNNFVGRLLVVDDPGSLNYGQSRVVASFDKRTGVIAFKSSMAYANVAGTMFRIEQAPSQRITSGRVSPTVGAGAVSAFLTANGLSNAISIDVGGLRDSGADLLPNETIYLWFQRDISLNTTKYEDNRVIFTAVYTNT